MQARTNATHIFCLACGPYWYVHTVYSTCTKGWISPAQASVCIFLVMDKTKSFPYYSSSYAEARCDFEDRAKSYSFNGPADNPEVKRRKRVAGYNMYSVEGKLKSSLRNSFKWIKNKFSDKYCDSWTNNTSLKELLGLLFLLPLMRISSTVWYYLNL